MAGVFPVVGDTKKKQIPSLFWNSDGTLRVGVLFVVYITKYFIRINQYVLSSVY